MEEVNNAVLLDEDGSAEFIEYITKRFIRIDLAILSFVTWRNPGRAFTSDGFGTFDR